MRNFRHLNLLPLVVSAILVAGCAAPAVVSASSDAAANRLKPA